MLNCTVNSNTNYVPYQIHYNKLIFNNLKLKLNISTEEIKNKEKYKQAKYAKKMMKTRILVKYTKGDMVFVKSNFQDKIKLNRMVFLRLQEYLEAGITFILILLIKTVGFQ
ncbi:hypothetical protein DMUE_0117 [Dictyocoela muelleri]|nr:hypothetical protein DMUE_0117 [Dictyocoela muelleri]